MKTITNAAATKKVNITEKDDSFLCMYVHVYQGEEQVLQTKRYSSLKRAEKWASGVLA